MTIRKFCGVITLLVLLTSFLPVLPASAASKAVGISPPAARVGDLVRFTGLVDYPGDRYELYWESIGPGNLIAS